MKMASTSSQISSEALSSSSSSKDLQCPSDKMKSKISSSKVQCDLCKLSYSTEKELTEHLLSLMHHTKLEDKETKPVHECIVCNTKFPCMTDYREHIGTNQHKKNLNKLRGIEEKPPEEKKKKGKRCGRQETWLNPQKWSGNNFSPIGWGKNQGSSPWQSFNYNQHNNSNNSQFNIQGWPHQALVGFHSSYNHQYSYRPGLMGSHPKWGSGAFEFRKPNPRGAPFGRYNQSHNFDFSEDSFDYNCDELWLQKREQLLADMEQDYPPVSRTVHTTPNFYNKQNRFSQFPSQKPNLQKQFDTSSKDRKRHREDDVQESLSKTVKQFGDEIAPGDMQGEGLRSSSSQNTNQPSKLKNDPEVLSQGTRKASDVTIVSQKANIDNTSDNLLERAERLCKELREKRESSQAMRSNLLKAKNNRNLSDKIGALAKRQMSYFKGHIKDVPLKTSVDKSTASIKESISSHESSPSEKSSHLSLHTPKGRSRNDSDDKKAAERDRVDENILSTIKLKTYDLSKGVSLSGDKNQPQKSPRVEQRRISTAEEEAKDINSSPGVEAQKRRPSKNALTKDNLLKMVNSPKSRTERVQLARMLQTRGDNKSSPSAAAPRTNVNLEGLYDEGETGQDIHLDLGAGTDTQVIKLEDLSENVRSQIMSIIDEDIARKDTLYDFLDTNVRNDTLYSSFGINVRNDSLSGSLESNAKKDSLHGSLDTKRPQVSSDRSSNTNSVSDFENAKESRAGKNSHSLNSASALYDKSIMSDVKKKSEDNVERVRRRLKSTDIDLKGKLTHDKAKTVWSKDYHYSRDVQEKGGRVNVERNSNLERNVDITSEPDAVAISRTGEVVQESSWKNSAADTSLTLNDKNIMDRFPTIMKAAASRETATGQTGNVDSSLPDSGISLCSTASHSSPSHQSFDRPNSQPSVSIVSHSQMSKDSSFVSPHSKDSRITPIPKLTSSTSCEDKSDSTLDLNAKSKSRFDDESSLSSSHPQDDSSQTMSELLVLSEREEEVKQEMMSMELRLTRLHRLLEQAVFQINKCTERRNELHEEEKSLTSQRMDILRAVSSRQSSAKASVTDTHNSSMCSSSSRDIQNSTAPLSQVLGTDVNQKVPDSIQDNTSDVTVSDKSSLSRSEWLAKFSAFLPSNAASSTALSSQNAIPSTIVTRANYIASFTIPNTVQSQTLSSGLTLPVVSRSISLEKSDSRQRSEDASIPSVPKLKTVTSVSLSDLPSSVTASSGETSLLSSSNMNKNLILFGQPYERTLSHSQDLTSSTNPSNTLEKGSQISSELMQFEASRATSCLKDTYVTGIGDRAEKMSKVHADEGIQLEPTKEVSTIRPPALRKPDCFVLSPRNEDSDIGSVASLASGSSLGEKISHYCKETPGASLDVPSRHDLSVIWSGPSDSNDLKDAEDQHSNNDSVCVDSTKKSLYGSLCQEAVRSAEALHLMERNSDGLAGASTSVKEVKKKKRKTKHERNTGATRRRRGYILSSSSDGEVAPNDTVQDEHLSAIESRDRRPLDSPSGDSSNSDVVEIRTSSDQNSPSVKGSQSKKVKDKDVTIAECDSSTYLGMVDTDSINAQSHKLKEMNENFIRTFGCAPRLKNSRSHISSVQEMATVCDTSEGGKGKSTRGIVISSDSDNEKIVNLCSDSDENDCQKLSAERSRFRLSFEERSSTETSVHQSKFPSQYGSVMYLKVIRERLYAGYQHSGFEVFDLAKEINLKDKGMLLPGLRCMEAFEADGHVKVIVGLGSSVCSIDIETKNSTMADMRTEVNCLHKIGHSVHVGLDTGEICVLDGKMSKLNRYICSDAPVFCMASGQEGSTQLLCVASLDSTITVMDSERCLPLRILLGHSKAALSLQVHGRFLYSCSGDSTVVVHNLHTAAVEKIHKDNKGIVFCVCYNEGFLFTGGMDRLVRCYNAKTHKLVQVYYGADMAAIKSICINGKKLITGNTSGSVDVVTIDLKAKNKCPKPECGLNFGIKSHLAWHLRNVHHDNRTL